MPPTFDLKVEDFATGPIPSIQEFEQLWEAWDFVSQHMVDDKLAKPIHLRHPYIFYLGHIPTFLDIHVTKVTGNSPTDPAAFHTIFERGVDPDVDSGVCLHSHSTVPATWPEESTILVYQEAVRKRVKSLYPVRDLKVGRALWLAFEHEAMHLETFLYMLVQSLKTIPPMMAPDFESIAAEAKAHEVDNEWTRIPLNDHVTIGISDPEVDDGPEPLMFGWDNEKPQRRIKVQAFEAKARPITNGDMADFLEKNQSYDLPASWSCDLDSMDSASHNRFIDNKSVKTVFGLVPLQHARDWAFCGSYDLLSNCATYMGGRLPTSGELYSLYQYADSMKPNGEPSVLSRKIPAVNASLSENGVATSPGFENGTNEGTRSDKLDPHFLHHWHPIPVTGNKLSGRGDMGGVWEWTSSHFERYEGFEAGRAYSGYSEDFFDGLHNIVLGGSWATHPRIADRSSFVNWFQRNYQFAFIGARVVRDLPGA